MGSKTLFKWSKTITSIQVKQLIQAERDIQKAILIFDSATAEYPNGFRHDNNTFGLMISKLAFAKKFKSTENLLKRMKDENCNITEDIFLSICRAYGKVHRPLDALRIFHQMKEFQCEPTQKAYVTVFAILVKENQLKMAQKFHKYMREMGIPPNVTSLNVLIKALCMNEGTMDSALQVFREMPDHGCIPDSYTYGTLINGLFKLGKVGEAKELYQKMKRNNCSPTVVTYTSLIHGFCVSSFCVSSNLDEAMELFTEMSNKGVEPNVVTFSCLMNGLCKGGRSLQAVELLERMVSKRLSPNMITYSTIIDGLCKEGKLKVALEFLDRMKLQGLKPDVGLYGKIIIGFCDCCKFQQAANFLDEMVLSGISPHRLTWTLQVKIHNMVVLGLCSQNDLNRAFQVYLSTRTRGISINEETFNCLVSCFCKTGDIHKAAHVVSEMMKEGCLPDEVTWNVVVGGFWSQRKVRETAETIQLDLIGEFLEPRA